VKVIAIQEAEGQLAGLIAEACRGEEIVLTDGFNRAKLVSEALDLNPKNYDRH
jgi:antitoxin (DNA-binding transcriptional repressor) of toxin-antitoxin stability system